MRTAVARRAQAAVPSCRLVMARYGQGGAGVAGQGDGFVEQGQAPDGAAAVEDACGFPFDVGLGEDGFDDLAHLAVVDDGVGVAVQRQDGAVVGAGDALPAVDRLIARGAVGVEVGECVDLGGDGVPVESGELAGLVPVAGVVRQDGSFLVPGHFPDGEHGLDVCWHGCFFLSQVRGIAVVLARRAVGAEIRRPGRARGWESPSAVARPAGWCRGGARRRPSCSRWSAGHRSRRAWRW